MLPSVLSKAGHGMPKLKPANVIQALVLFDKKGAVEDEKEKDEKEKEKKEKKEREYWQALWAALYEVERFYRLAPTQIEYRRFYIAPSPGPATASWIPLGQVQTALDLLKNDLSSSGRSAELSRSRRRTYDRTQLAAIIRKLVDAEGSGDHLMIITDRPITPPGNLRYIIWETDPNTHTSVISVSPLDPEYWREEDPKRLLRIKIRTRNAALSIIGELIGLERCDNPACFLFDDVDSVTVLDEMYAFGAEHNLSELTGRGFDDDTVIEPSLVQSATFQPMSRRAR